MSTQAHNTVNAGAEKRPDPHARLREVRTVAGFMPTSRIELVEAWQLLEPHIVNQYLDSVLGHQEKHSVQMPRRAVVTKTRNYAGFAGKARTDRWMLGDLLTGLARPGSATTLAEADLVTGVGQLVRYHDLDRFAQETPEKLPFEQLYPHHNGDHQAADAYTLAHPPTVVADRIASVASSLNIEEATKFAHAALADQDARYKFWEERATEAGAMNAGQALGNAALEALGVPAQG